MSQFQVCRRVLVLVLALCLGSLLPAQRIKLLQLEQKGTPKEGYFGLTNSDGNQRYVAHDSLVTTIITANGHWYLNGIDDAYGVSTISPGETVAFTGNDGSFRGIVAGLLFSGTNTIFIDGRALQWNLGANGSYTTIGDVQGSSESVNFVGSGSVSTSRSGNTITITGTDSDSGTDWDLGANGSYTIINNGEQVNFVGAGIAVTSRLSNTITITATEVDGSTSNEIDTWDLGANSSYTNISNGEQVNFVGAGDVTTSRTGNTITITGSSSATDLTFTGASSPYTLNSSTGTDVTFASGGIISLSRSVNQLTISATEVDGSTTNEIQGLDWFNASSPVTLYADGSADGAMIVAGSGISLSMATDQLTITATDASVTNEAQTWSNSGTTSYTGTLSTAGGAGGGAFTIAAGSNVSVSHSAGTVTIAASAGSTDLTFTGASSPYTLNSSTGTDVTFASGGIVSLSRSVNELTISATEVDGSVSNELQTIAVTGTTTGITTLSNSGGSMTIAAGGINSIGVAGSTITITATEVDGSTSNELQTWANSGTTSYTGTLSNSGGSFTIAAGSNVSVSHSAGTVTIASSFTEVDGSTSNELQTIAVTGTTTGITTLSNSGGSMTIAAGGINSIGVSGSTITITATEVDGSVTNEAQTWSNSGTTSYTGTLSTAGGAGGGSFTIAAGSNVSVSHSAGTVTIASSFTEVDGSTTNELQTIAVTGTTTGITTLSNSGGSMTIAAGGINSIGVSGSTITITATEVDGSTTNELQTWGNSGTTSYTGTLSNSGGSFTIAAGSGISVSHSAGTVTIASSAAATDLTFTGTGPFTLNSSTGTDVTFTEGLNIDITRSVNDLSFKATPAGSNTYVQYNSSGSFGSDVEFSFNSTTDVLTSGNYIVGDWVGTSPNGSIVFSNSSGQLDNTNNHTGGWNYFSTTKGGFLGDFYIGSAVSTYDNFYMPVYSLTGDGSGGLGYIAAEGSILTTWTSTTSATIPDGTVYAAGSETHSSITLTLGSSPAGRIVYIANHHDSNNLTISAGSSINGESTITIGPNDGGVFVCTGAPGTWWKF